MTPNTIFRICNTLEKRGLSVGVPLILQGRKANGRAAAYVAAAVVHELNARGCAGLADDVLDRLLEEAARETIRR